MSDDAIEPGCVLHWDGFKLSDGSEGHKFFVVVGSLPDKNYLAIIATSKQKRRAARPGGNPDGGWYQELSAAELVKLKFERKIRISGKLRGDIANAICNCMRKCDDVSEYHKSLLGPAIQPKKKT